MDLPPEADGYIMESIESSLGLPVSADTLRLKLLASEDSRHRLHDQIFVLEQRLRQAHAQLEHSKAEASMNAQGLRRCVEEKEAVAAGYTELAAHCAKLERECTLYEQDLERIMESCDELAKENEDLRTRPHDNASVTTLAAEVEQLQNDKEHLRVNLHKAEEEVTVLFEENKLLDEENTKLLRQLNRERHHQGSDGKHSASASAKGKRKSRLREVSPTGAIDFSGTDSSRPPLSPLHQNSPDSRMTKK